MITRFKNKLYCKVTCDLQYCRKEVTLKIPDSGVNTRLAGLGWDVHEKRHLCPDCAVQINDATSAMFRPEGKGE